MFAPAPSVASVRDGLRRSVRDPALHAPPAVPRRGFDLDALPACGPGRGDAGPLPFDAKLVLDAPSARAGDEIGATIVLTNTSSAEANLDMVETCAAFHIELWRNGKRADLVNTGCGTGGGCGGKGMRLVVAPNGTVKKHMTLRARLVRFCEASQDGGPLVPGVYEVRAANPLGSFPLQAKALAARASVTLTK